MKKKNWFFIIIVLVALLLIATVIWVYAKRIEHIESKMKISVVLNFEIGRLGNWEISSKVNGS